MALPYKFQAKTLMDEGRVSPAALTEIQEWLSTTNLPLLQEEMIVLFLLSCGNDTGTTKNTMSAYFRIKKDAPEIFKNRDIDNEDVKTGMEVVTCSAIPARLNDNTAIHFFKLNDTNYKHFDLIVNMKLSFMLIDITQRYNPPNDVIILIDLKGATLMHLTCVKMSAIKKYMDFMQEAMPIKIHKIHVLNANFLFDKCLAIAKLFMKSELIKVIHPHSPKMKLEEFHRDWIPASCLPQEYGGELPSSLELNQVAVEQLRELKEFFVAEENLISSYEI